jgi:hypothetical protein
MATSSLSPVCVGDKFGRWTVISQSEPRIYRDKTKKTASVHIMWSCICECGVSSAVSEMNLKNSKSTSCGCYTREASRRSNTKHGESRRRSPEYNAWQTMRDRCLNPRNKRFAKYGGRGITICDRWLESYTNFLEDMGRRPSAKHSLDRENNDKGYDKDNCRWTTSDVQMTNRSVTRYVDTPDGRIPLATLAKKHGIPANALRFRILKGWALDAALSTPVRDKNPNGRGRKNPYIPLGRPSSRDTVLPDRI